MRNENQFLIGKTVPVHGQSRIRLAIRLVVPAMFFLVCGCESVSNPWAGTPYQSPSANDQRGQIIYSPTPEILPSQKIDAFNSQESDAELERTLFGSQ